MSAGEFKVLVSIAGLGVVVISVVVFIECFIVDSCFSYSISKSIYDSQCGRFLFVVIFHNFPTELGHQCVRWI